MTTNVWMRDAALLAAVLLTGSAATVVPRTLLRFPCSDGRAFDAPLMTCMLVSACNALCVAGEWLWSLRSRPRDAERVRDDDAAQIASGVCAHRLLKLLPACALNFLSFVSQLTALACVSAAVLAGLRGFLIVCTAAASAVIRSPDRPRSAAEWSCIGACAAGATCIGAAAMLSPNNDAPPSVSLPPASGAALGVGLCLLGYTCASGQWVCEQMLLRPPAPAASPVELSDSSDKAAPLLSVNTHTHTHASTPRGPAQPPFSRLEIVGTEGCVCTLLCAISLACLRAVQTRGSVDMRPLDDPIAAADCLAQQPTVTALLLAYGMCSVAFNVSLIFASGTSPNTRAFLFTARGGLTWAVEVLLFYAFNLHDLGDNLDLYSILQLAGYLLLIGGGYARLRLVSPSKH